ncbi:DUF2268 domain-containing protein [Paenibacillus arenosi]|uniref:DUF2268 domain-containing protein n=1 Tax=Paenibacillus arenosi TaxID=2774142 RepID=A0ABR9AWC0_9BACL|nr:DUF2268 domain-containing putative Zn-dependent protease [Paenibacillus arenosi]MBD8498429.1 hypothetical protein [Paenibacillus arenosi]
MNIQWIDTMTQYQEIYQLPMEKRRDYFRYKMMGPFEDMWSTIQVPLKPATEGGYDVVMACEMMGILALNEDERGLAAVDMIKASQAEQTLQRSLQECVRYAEQAELRVAREKLIAGMYFGNPEKLKPHNGYSGFGGIPGYIQLYIYPNEYNLKRLPALIAHEFHHNIRFSYFNWSHGDVTLGEYMIIEGLAESFAAAMYGEELIGPWVTSLDEDDLAYSIEVMRTVLGNKGFDGISGYMFGDEVAKAQGYTPVGMSYGAGYAVGYHIVQSFLKRNNVSIVEATLMKEEDIIQGSGVFG